MFIVSETQGIDNGLLYSIKYRCNVINQSVKFNKSDLLTQLRISNENLHSPNFSSGSERFPLQMF